MYIQNFIPTLADVHIYIAIYFFAKVGNQLDHVHLFFCLWTCSCNFYQEFIIFYQAKLFMLMKIFTFYCSDQLIPTPMNLIQNDIMHKTE